MKTLHIKPKKDSPEVIFNPITKHLSISGVCHPENVMSFFDEPMRWLDQFFETHKTNGDKAPVVLSLYFRYFNSATYKYLLTFLQRYKDFQTLSVPISLEWYYEPEDEEMKESCIELFEFSELDIPFKCIEAKE